MIPALDSAAAPTRDQALAARAAGYRMWNGYLATQGQGGSAYNLLHVWTREDFQTVQEVFGGQPVGFCSGWDDPAGVRALGAAWGVRPCLDDEDGIRPVGSWKQPWLDVSGAGLYGNWWRHSGFNAAFHILSAYPTSGDPTDASWWDQSPRPSGPCGWQWAGSHIQFGVDVDSEWLDDWFGGEMFHGEADFDAIADQMVGIGGTPNPSLAYFAEVRDRLGAILMAVQTPPTVDVNALATALAPHLPPTTDPQVVATDVVAALKAQFDKP